MTLPRHWLTTYWLALRRRVVNMAYALDCCLFTLCTLGRAAVGESFSSAAWRAETMGLFYGRARPVIDWLFARLGDHGHCRRVYMEAGLDLPADMRAAALEAARLEQQGETQHG